MASPSLIESSAPGRCGILGNPTDGYGGTVISSALAERATVCLSPLPAGRHELSICGHHETLDSCAPLALNRGFTDVAKAVLIRCPQALDIGFRMEAETTVPVQAGLAGSTTMLIAILGAVLRLLGRDTHPYGVAEIAREIEFNVMGVTCGFHDQYLAAFGGLNCVDFRGKEPRAGQPVAVETLYGTVEPLAPYGADLPLLLANTGVPRDSGSVHSPLRERWLAGDPEVVGGYQRCAQLAREGKAALLARDWPTFGALMNENHTIQRDLGGSGEANERLIAAASAAGAAGAKLAGAGKGGTIIALHEDLPHLCRKLEEAGAARLLRVIPSPGLTVTGDWA